MRRGARDARDGHRQKSERLTDWDFAAFGFVALVWWTWPLVFVIVMAAVWAGYRLENWRDARAHDKKHHGKFPCLAHIGTNPIGSHYFCGQLEGHEGPHGGEVLFSALEELLEPLDVDDSRVCEHEFLGHVCVLDRGHTGPHDLTDGS